MKHVHKYETSIQMWNTYTNMKQVHKYETRTQIWNTYTNMKHVHKYETRTQIWNMYTNMKHVYKFFKDLKRIYIFVILSHIILRALHYTNETATLKRIFQWSTVCFDGTIAYWTVTNDSFGWQFAVYFSRSLTFSRKEIF